MLSKHRASHTPTSALFQVTLTTDTARIVPQMLSRMPGKKRWLGRPDHDLFAENARVNGFQDDSRCDALEETENSLAGVWDTEAFLYAFEVETPQIISRAAHALPDGKCFSLGNPPGLLIETIHCRSRD